MSPHWSPPLFELRRFESNELAHKADALRRLLDRYAQCRAEASGAAWWPWRMSAYAWSSAARSRNGSWTKGRGDAAAAEYATRSRRCGYRVTARKPGA